MTDTSGVIYSLVCPKTGLVRYIGQTKQLNPIKRYYQHKYQWQRSEHLSHLNSWIKSLYKENLFPTFIIIEDCIDITKLDIVEKEYIKFFKAIGARLTNTDEGGKGNITRVLQKDEWKKKRLETLKTSEKWKRRAQRHSEIMKEKHLTGTHKIGFKYLTQEQLEECHRKAGISNGQKICSIDDSGNIIKEFDSIKEAAIFYNIKDSTHIVKVCKGKSKSGKTHGIRFIYIEGCGRKPYKPPKK